MACGSLRKHPQCTSPQRRLSRLKEVGMSRRHNKAQPGLLSNETPKRMTYILKIWRFLLFAHRRTLASANARIYDVYRGAGPGRTTVEHCLSIGCQAAPHSLAKSCRRADAFPARNAI